MSKSKASKYDEFQTGDRVNHSKFGEGQVLQRSGMGEETKLVVKFSEEGEKRLLAKYANLRKVNPVTTKEETAEANE